MTASWQLLVSIMAAILISTRSVVVAAFNGGGWLPRRHHHHLKKRSVVVVRMSLLDDFASPFPSTAARGLLGTALIRAMNTLTTTNDAFKSTIHNKKEEQSEVSAPPMTNYTGNPCIHFTSLAHLQWKYVLRPGIDAAIDATCGNGNDSCALANLLFADPNPGQSQLICIDTQEAACHATRMVLEETIMDTSIMEHHVQILHTSHASLPITTSPLALVCWNLGYLPKSLDKSATACTKMESTLSSITDAALQLRIGGLLSVMTYPKTNANEDLAVHALFECMALLTSKHRNWKQYLATLPPDPMRHDENDDNDNDNDDRVLTNTMFTVRDEVTKAMHRIVQEGDPQQTWRAMEHQTMGRHLSPMLLTMTRIK